MTRLPDTDRARLPLGKRGAFEGVARWPWMASGMGTDEARTTATNHPRDHAQRVVEKVGRSITNSETPHKLVKIPAYQQGETWSDYAATLKSAGFRRINRAVLDDAHADATMPLGAIKNVAPPTGTSVDPSLTTVTVSAGGPTPTGSSCVSLPGGSEPS
jgi:beta-lactam-binding protein with PASTA domain